MVVDLGVSKTNKCILVDRSVRTNWISLAAKYPSKYTYLGAVRAGLTEERVIAEAEMQLDDMGQYSMLTNNCYIFVEKMYEVHKLL
jgi:hypothetical protein